MRLLAVSDTVEAGWCAADVRRFRPDVVVACGDLPFEYLAWLGNAVEVPVVFVPGNHDPDLAGYRQTRSGLVLRAGIPTEPPWPTGSTNADGRVVEVGGLRIAGLGGCLRYGDGPNQYTERQQARRARWLRWRARRWIPGAGGDAPVDLLLTHAPPGGMGDGPDPAHRGFTAFHGLVGALRPRFLLHGHVDPSPRAQPARIGATEVVNVVGHKLLTLQRVGDSAVSHPTPAPGRV